jgi:hypothetical protein
VVVDAIVALLEAGSLQGSPDDGGDGGKGVGGSGAAVAMDFAARLAAAGRVTVSPAFAARLLRHLASSGAATGAGGAVEAEERFVAALQNVGVNAPGERFDQEKLDLQVKLPEHV